MEILFENWRRKASLPENLIKEGNNNQDKKKTDLVKTAKSAYSLLKMFKVQSAENNPKIKRTTSAKKFLRSHTIETSGETVTASEQQPVASEGEPRTEPRTEPRVLY